MATQRIRAPIRFARGIVPVIVLMGLFGVPVAGAATFTVSKTADTNDGVCNADCSLREAIVAANGNGVPDTIAFNIPLADPGYNAGTGVFTINIGSLLPAITGAGTTVDGTTQTTNVGNTNPLIFGTGGTVGLGPDAVASTGDEAALAQVAGPEIEIRGVQTLAYGLSIQSNNGTIRGLAILGFGANDGEGSIRIENNFTGALIEQNLAGSTAASFSDPGAAIRTYTGVHSAGGDSGTIRNNLVGFTAVRGIWLTAGSANWTVQGNEVRDAGLSTMDGDGITINASGPNTITANLITGASSQGFIITQATANNNNFNNNTVTGNGVGIPSGVLQSAGMTMRSSAGPTVFDRNLISANYGAGLQVNSGATGIRLTSNSFVDNGTIIARDGSPPTGQVGLDLNAVGDNANFGTSPFYTINDSGDGDGGGNNLLNFPIIDTATITSGNLVLTGWARPGSIIEFYIANPDGSGFGEGETYLVTLTEGSGADTDAGSSVYGPGPINGLSQGTDNTNQFRFSVPTPAGVSDGSVLTATATVGADTSEFSGNVTVATSQVISGRVFEDADFAGTASAYDGGLNDLALPVVDVELYTSADAYVSSTFTDGSGNYAFTVGNGDYKIRVRSATIGDSNTPPAGGFNAACGITDPASGVACAVAEQTWGDAAAAYGGQSATADDTATNDNAGPGDSWIAASIAGADKTGLDFGFAYNLIVNAANSGQGSLRRFIENANAIGAAAGTTANSSEFRIPVTDPNYNAGTGVFTITLASVLPIISDAGTDINGRTQTDNVGNTNAGPFVHPFYGAATDVGTGADGIEASGDEPGLVGLNKPEVEIDGNDQGVVFELAANSGKLKRLAIYNAPSFDTGVLASGGTTNVIEENFIGLRADGSDPGPGQRVQHGVEVFGGTAIVRDNVVAYTENTAIIVERETTIQGNDVYSASLGNPNGDGISTEGSSGQTITIRNNRVDLTAGVGVETWQAPGPFMIEDNTVSRSGQGGGAENGGVRAFGTGSTITHNVINGNAGAGIALVQRGVPGSNQQNRVSENAVYANGGPGIDLDVTNTGGAGNPNGDGVTANNGVLNATLPNSEMDYPVFAAATLIGSALTVSGYVGTVGTQIAGTHTIEAFKADDDGNNNGEIEAGDALNVPHGEGHWYLDTCTSAVTGFFSCTLTVPGAVSLSVGDVITATARDASNNTSEFAANISVTPGLTIYKRAFWPNGTPIADGATIPQGVVFRFMLFINNQGPAVTDVSVQDVLDPLFAYQPGSIRVDNSVAACALQICTPVEEAAVFAAVTAAPLSSDAVDGDSASFSPTIVDLGNQNAANAQLDIAGNRVLALVFSAKVQ